MYRSRAGVPVAGLGVEGLRWGGLGGRCEALGELPGGGGGGRFTGVSFSSWGEPALGSESTMAGSLLSLAMFPSTYLLALGLEGEGHFGTEGRGSSSFPPLKNIASSPSSSAETDC